MSAEPIVAIRQLWPLLPLTAVGYSVVLAERGLWAGPYFASVHGLDPVARGNALLLMAAAMSAGALIYGPLDRLLGTRKWVVAAGSAATAAGFLVLGLVELPLARCCRPPLQAWRNLESGRTDELPARQPPWAPATRNPREESW